MKDRALIAPGIESSKGFVSQRKDSRPVPLEALPKLTPSALSAVCDGEVLSAVKNLSKLRRNFPGHLKNKFWDQEEVKRACFRLEDSFREQGWLKGVATARPRNIVLKLVSRSLNTTVQTFNEKLQSAFIEHSQLTL